MAGSSIDDNDNYGQRFAKLLPGESTAAFVAINGLVAAVSNVGAANVIAIAFTAVILLCTWWLLARVKKIESGLQIGLTLLAFPLWAISIRPEMVTAWFNNGDLETYIKVITVAVMAVTTIFAPVVTRVQK